MTREDDNPMTGSDFDWMVSNHAVLGWRAPVKASVSGISLLNLSSFFAFIFPSLPPETPDTQAKENAENLNGYPILRRKVELYLFLSTHCDE